MTRTKLFLGELTFDLENLVEKVFVCEVFNVVFLNLVKLINFIMARFRNQLLISPALLHHPVEPDKR